MDEEVVVIGKGLFLKSLALLVFAGCLVATLYLGIMQGELQGAQEVCDNLDEPLTRWASDGELHCGEPEALYGLPEVVKEFPVLFNGSFGD